MTDFSKKSETEKFFNSIITDLKKSKIKAIFSPDSPSWGHYRGYRTYSTDAAIYVLLENDCCLVINYRFIDALDVQFRELTSFELDAYSGLQVKDFFNTVNDIYDPLEERIYQTETCSLDYGSIEDVSLRSVTKEYSKWQGNHLDFVSPTEETFDEIKFTMSNGKTFVICAADAVADGYTLLWSEDTVETLTKEIQLRCNS